MEIILNRTSIRKDTCDGRIEINNKHVCDTVENPACLIPAGSYDVELKHKEEWGRKMPVIMTPNGEEVALICTGNGAFGHKDGRIIVGEKLVRGVVIHSGEVFRLLYDRIKVNLRRSKPVSIRIRE